MQPAEEAGRGDSIGRDGTMGDGEELKRSLEELRRVTGLNLSLAGGEEEDPAALAEKIRLLTGAWQEKYDRTGFLRNLVLGNVSESDLHLLASRFHIAENTERVLYVIESFPGNTEKAAKVVRQMFLTKSGDLTAVLDDTHLVLLKLIPPAAKRRRRTLPDPDRGQEGRSGEEREKYSDEIQGTADTIADMLNTEAMIRVRVGYGAPTANIREIPGAYREAVLALKIGKTFYENLRVMSYERLGVGRLICDLPEETCRLFLKETLGSPDIPEFDEETTAIINAFFKNNLNISETARQLYVHRNTLVYRIGKIGQTGLDLRVFDDAVKMKLAMMIADALRARHRES